MMPCVLARQQNLRGNLAVFGEKFFVDVHKHTLANGRQGLLFRDGGGFYPRAGTPGGNSPRGDKHYLPSGVYFVNHGAD